MTTYFREGDQYTCRLERVLSRWSAVDQALYRAAKEVMHGTCTAEQAAVEYDLWPDDIEEMAAELYAHEQALDALTLRQGFINE